MIEPYEGCVILCPREDCSWYGCIRNQKQYTDQGIPVPECVHIYATIPEDCPKAHKMVVNINDNH